MRTFILFYRKASLFIFAILTCTLGLNAQNFGTIYTVEVTANVQTSPASITLNWEENTQASGDNYYIWRKVKGTSGWGISIAGMANTVFTYTDNSAVVGTSYEYYIQKRTGNTVYSWGYINAGIDLSLTPNRGDILLLVDSTFVSSLSAEITQLKNDLYNDGWNHTTIYVNPLNSPASVKSTIVNQYNSLNSLKTVYLLGHIPVPYSGNLNPDAHPDHEGAWPADVYYGDVDGSWTDTSVNNTVASSSRNHNVPSDGKFDQSTVPSAVELEVCRVDFDDLSTFTANAETLLSSYLTRAHEFKTAQYVPQEKGLIDVGNFGSFNEGFAQNGYRNFTPFFGPSGIDSAAFFPTLTSSSYLWSYGCGAGSYASIQGLNGASALYSSDLATTGIQSSFTMLFGSYFGDWDNSNNIMRSTLASGKTLAVSWAGRPNFHYHTLAMGEHLGYSAKMSQDIGSDYLSLSLGVVTGEGVHVAQLGDPSLRMYYIEPASNLLATAGTNIIDLVWNASPDLTIDGYNLYRKDVVGGLWAKVNTSIITGTSYSDNSISTSGTYEYMVKATKLKTNSSGSFYNESLGSTDFEGITFVSCTIAASITSSNVSVYGGSDGGAEVSVSAGLSTITYLWSTGETTDTIAGVVAGSYSVTVYDAILPGCQDTTSVTILQPAPPTCDITLTLSGNDVTFNGGSDGDALGTITGEQGNVSYLWNSGETTAGITGLIAGTYSVTVTDDVIQGCQVIALITVSEPELDSCQISITLLSNNISAVGADDGTITAIELGGLGNVSYLWSNGSTSASLSGLAAGIYVVTCSDDVSIGCVAIDSVIISEPNSVVNNSWDSKLSLFPNPTSGIVTIRSDIEIAEVEIVDVSGRIVVSSFCGKKEVTYELSDFEHGIYFARVLLNNGEVISEKFILN